MKKLRIPTLFLATALQMMPMLRNVIPMQAQGIVPSVWAYIFQLGVGATALGAYDAIGAATAPYFNCATSVTGYVAVPFVFKATITNLLSTDPGVFFLSSTPSAIPIGLALTTVDNSPYTFGNVYGLFSGTPTTLTNNSVVSVTAGYPSQTPVTTNVSFTILPTPIPLPASNNIAAGSNVTFTITAGPLPLTYRWRFNATNFIAGATNASYTLTNAQATNAGSFTVVITNTAGSFTSAPAVLTINSGVAPSISAAPTNLTVTAGQPAAFSVTASGTAPLAYQWRFNVSSNILGATNASYTITNAQPVHAGNYTVVITNVAGSITSSPAASLTVNVPPGISAAPTNLAVSAGQPAAFTVTASGTAPLNYQWRRGGAPIAGATGTNYSIANARARDNAAAFTVVITNVAGSITSAPAATLTVSNPPPPVTGTMVQQGGNFLFTFTPVVGLTNTVLTNSSAESGAWNALTNVPPPASASSITVTDSVAGPARFYRVLVVP